MRKTLTLTLLASLALAAPASAVNLVPNPSFEIVSPCPGGFGWAYVAAPWDAPTAGTSDVLNACATGPFAPSVPTSVVGTQTPITCVGMGGVITYDPFNLDYREYLQVPLSAPLATGLPYLVEFWVSCADSMAWATDRIGARLGVGAVGPLFSNTTLNLTPQVETPAGTPITNSSGWTLVSGTVIGAGQDHLIIGSFRNDANTVVGAGPGWRQFAYYFVENVKVELSLPTDQACCLPDGTCATMLPGECQAVGGFPAGPGTSCATNPCDPVSSAKRSWGAIKTLYR